MRTLSILLSILILALLAAGHKRGIPWGCEDKHAEVPLGPLIVWYHHWADGHVEALDKQGLEFIYMFWGMSQYDKWSQRKKEMANKLPKYILAQNEPDVPSQGNTNPDDAAQQWMKELAPYAAKGVKVSTPQVCWDLNWFKKFKKACDKLNCNISFVAIHWYGSYKDFAKLQNWVTEVHKLYGLPVWITEFGITAKSDASQEQINAFYSNANQWFQNHDWIERSSWLGGFAYGHAPDAYPSQKGAFMNPDGSHRELLRIAGNQQHPTYTPEWFKIVPESEDPKDGDATSKQKRSQMKNHSRNQMQKRHGKKKQ